MFARRPVLVPWLQRHPAALSKRQGLRSWRWDCAVMSATGCDSARRHERRNRRGGSACAVGRASAPSASRTPSRPGTVPAAPEGVVVTPAHGARPERFVSELARSFAHGDRGGEQQSHTCHCEMSQTAGPIGSARCRLRAGEPLRGPVRAPRWHPTCCGGLMPTASRAPASRRGMDLEHHGGLGSTPAPCRAPA